MSQHNNPSIVSDGLAFAYDQANPKSYKGPAIKNFLTQIQPRGIGDNGTTYRFFSGTEEVYIPEVGTVTSAYVDMYNDYNGGSNNCCPSPYGYGQGLTVTGNTQYTYAILYKSYNRYTNPNWMYHYEYGPNGYITEYGVHMVGGYSGQETHLGDGWYWSRAIFTTNSNCNTLYTGSWMYQYATWNRFYVAKVALLEGNWLDLHPKYWPDLNTTRTNTQILSDLTGTATSITASLNNTLNTISFTNSNYIDASVPQGLTGTGSWTMETWFRIKGVPSNASWQNVIIDTDATGGSANMIAVDWGGYHGGTTNQLVYATRPSTGGGYTTLLGPVLARNLYYHVCVVRNGSASTQLYVNGKLFSTYSGNMPTATQPLVRIGRWTDGTNYSNVDVPVAKIYSRALTAAEVTTNYVALESRFVTPIPEQNLILHLDANNGGSYPGSGTEWYDLSPSAYNFTLTGSWAYQTHHGLRCFNFDGGYSDVNCAIRTGSISHDISTACTINVLYSSISNQNFNSCGRLFSCGEANGNNVDFSTYFTLPSCDETKHGLWRAGAPQGFYVNSATKTNGDRWKLLTYSWTVNGTCKGYVNGVLETTTTTGGAFNWAGISRMAVAMNAALNIEHTRVRVSRVLMYNRQLSDSEVVQVFNNIAPQF